ncbi:hypothetical protein M407DRAFT_27969 [Tulasnella calospora MUT 4182]|uniref:Uncharacterized protein n=1 Tax=Tulasnella calospora MUT 4182 TaxID=1051891 RepID=A0A0C3KM91_9AGAM|nr:hypothetical protein M407DRAFT_27969 [Tulasnella calospora MUT 4182]
MPDDDKYRNRVSKDLFNGHLLLPSLRQDLLLTGIARPTRPPPTSTTLDLDLDHPQLRPPSTSTVISTLDPTLWIPVLTSGLLRVSW